MRPFSTRSLLLAALLTVGATACADTGSVTAPAGHGPAVGGPSLATATTTTIDFRKLYPRLSTQIPSVTMQGDTTVQTFTVNPPDGRLIRFGRKSGEVLAIPANTLCDPAQNSYGPTEWTKPCVLATSTISFEVRSWTGPNGRTYADFQPAIRFNPAAPVPVRLYFQDPTLTTFASVYIPYCNTRNQCVNEGATDAALETYVAPLSGGGYWVFRTLRHFSGYTVTAD